MKKLAILLLVVVIVMVLAAPAFAHPAVPEQSLGRVSINAAPGMGTAYHGAGNLEGKGGIAAHVFEGRFKSVFHPPVED